MYAPEENFLHSPTAGGGELSLQHQHQQQQQHQQFGHKDGFWGEGGGGGGGVGGGMMMIGGLTGLTEGHQQHPSLGLDPSESFHISDDFLM